MKNRSILHNGKKERITLHIQLAIILIMLIVVASIGSLYCVHSENVLLEESSNLIRESMLQINASIETTVEDVIDVSKQAYNDNALYPIMRNGGKNYDSYSFLIKKLEQIQNSSRNIASLAFYIEEEKRFIYLDYGMTSMPTVDDKSFLDWYQSGGTNIIVADTHPIKVGSNSGNVFSVFARLPMDNYNNFLGALIINIDQSMIYDRVIEKTGSNLHFYIVNDDGQILFSQHEDQLYAKIEDIPSLSGIHADVQDYRIVEIDDIPHLVVSSPGEQWGWNYVMLYPIDEVYSTITGIKTVVVLASVLLLAFSSAIVLFILARSFTKYDEVLAFIRHKLEISRTNKTGNLKEDVTGVFLDRELMQKKWDTIIPLFREKFYLGLLAQNNDREMLLEQMGRIGISLPHHGLVVCVLELEDTGEYKDLYNSYMTNLSVTGVVESCLSELNKQYFCVETADRRLALVAAMEPDQLIETMQQIIQIVNQRLKLSVSVGICDIPTEIDKLNQAYTHVLRTLPYKMLYGWNKVILCSDIDYNVQDTYRYPLEKEEKFKTFIKICDVKKSLAVLEDMFSGLHESRSYFAVQQFLYRLNASMMELMEELSILNSFMPAVNWQDFTDLRQAQDYFSAAVEDVIHYLQKNHETKTDIYFQRITAYIKSCYSQDISVEQVCAHVGLSTTYVNQILKKYTGHSFVQYLNDYRIEQACKLLKDSDTKIMSVGEQSGFSSAKYFIKLFKNNKGITPGEYRKQFHSINNMS